VGVNETNEFLFALPDVKSTQSFRGHDCIITWTGSTVWSAGAVSDYFTRLPKHILTASQIVNLKDNEMDVVSNFLGHDYYNRRSWTQSWQKCALHHRCTAL